jgi:kynurenine formamidase
MAALWCPGIAALCIAAFSMTPLPQKAQRDSMLEGIPSGKTRVLDLSYAINDKLVPWPGDEKFFEAKGNATIEKNGYFTRSFWMLEHYGTHLDAPAHFPPGKATVEQIPAKQFFGPAVVIDVRAESSKNADYLLPAAAVEDWEKRHGRIPEGAIVLLRTGWASRWPDVKRYRNQDASGTMHFPGFSAEAA